MKPEGYTYYFVSGAGSELSKTVVHPEGGVFAKAENGFMTFSISNNSMLVNVISLSTGRKAFYYNTETTIGECGSVEVW